MIPPPTVFFFKIILALQGPLRFHRNVRMDFSISEKMPLGFLIECALNPEIILGSIDILRVLSLSIHKHRMSFHLSVSSSISFINILELYALSLCLKDFTRIM